MIKRIKLFSNNSDISKEIESSLTKELLENEFIISDDDCDLEIAIGGDGTFLRMLKSTNFNSNILYIGINTGTVGYLQEVKPLQIKEFVQRLKEENYIIENIGIQETDIITSKNSEKIYSLNEILVRNKNLNITTLGVYIDDELLEKYVGDGIMVSTSIGSTAYNLSFGGSIVHCKLASLQITPVAPLNSKAYSDILNSIILPENSLITLVPIKGNKDLLITIDGVNKEYNEVEKIETTIKDKYIKEIRLNNYNFAKIINEKFLK